MFKQWRINRLEKRLVRLKAVYDCMCSTIENCNDIKLANRIWQMKGDIALIEYKLKQLRGE